MLTKAICRILHGHATDVCNRVGDIAGGTDVGVVCEGSPAALGSAGQSKSGCETRGHDPPEDASQPRTRTAAIKTFSEFLRHTIATQINSDA